MSKGFLFSAALVWSLATILPASAQHGHGHGHSHGHHHHGNFQHHYGHHHHHYVPYYGSGYFWTPGYSYVPLHGYGYSNTAPSNYQSVIPSDPGLPANRSRIQVILPDPEAALTIEGQKTVSLGRVRMFDPPPLEPGYTYWYKLTATWTQDGKTYGDVRTVSLVPGRLVTVDFTQPVIEEAPQPAKQKAPE